MEAEATKQSRLIGAILVENGLISRDQLARALEIQEEVGGKLGEIVVAEFDVPRIALAGVLAEQWAAVDGTSSSTSIKPAASLRVVPAPGEDLTSRRPIGSIFLELGFITPAQLDDALEQQRLTGERIGEILVDQGSLTRLDLASALAEQWSSLEKLRPPSPETKGQNPSFHSWTGMSSEASAAFDNSVSIALEERLTAIEGVMTSAGTGTQELETGLSELRASLASVETRIAAHAGEHLTPEYVSAVAAKLDTRIAALEGHDQSETVANLRSELDDLRSRPDLVDAVSELRAMVERLGDRPGTSLEIETLAADVAALGAQLDGLSTINDLENRVEAAAVQAKAARADAQRLSERIDALAGLEHRIDEIVARVPPDGALEAVVEQLRVELSEIAAGHLRLDTLAGSVADVSRVAAPDATEGIEARLSALAAQGDTIAALENRVSELEASLVDVSWAAGLRDEIRQVAETTAAERASLEEALMRRVAEIASTDARTDELADLRARLDQIPATHEDHAVRRRVDALEGRLDALGRPEGSIGEVRAVVGEVDAARAAEALSTANRLVEIEVALEALSARAPSLAARTTPSEAGLDSAEALVAASSTTELADRISDVAAKLDDSAIQDLRESIAGIESLRVADALAAGARLAGVESVLGALVRGESVDRSHGELRAEIGALAGAPTSDELDEAIAELVTRIDRVASDAGDRITSVAEDLTTRVDANALELGRRVDDVATSVVGLLGQQDLDAAAARHVEWVRSELATLSEAGDVRASRLEAGLAAIEATRDASEKERSDHVDATVASIWSALRERQLALDPQLEAQSVELAALRVQVAALQADRADQEGRLEGRMVAEMGSLGARIDELVGLRRTDIQATRAVDERHAEQVDALAARLEDEQGATRSVTAALSVELADLESRLRADLDSIAARFEGFHGASIDERLELAAELERLAASMGWRLERIEESLVADETSTLRATVEQLGRHVENQSALREEEARATERALRKGLASLGERLVDSESVYVEAGNTLRRSIERLGAAVVEADARMADQIPVSPLEGCVAFAPTADGYRLVELPGERPEVGEIVEVGVCDEPLVVTRYGRSPLPFDGRPCAYLDRV